MVLEYIDKYKKEIKNCINDLKCKNTLYKQIPNLLTFSRAALSPISSILFLTGHPMIGVIYTGLLLSTDLFDGKFARKWKVQSKFGADLDAFCDKIMFLWLSLPLMISNSLILLNFVFEGLISGVNVFGRMKGLNTKTVFSGKVKTCVLSLMLISGYLVQFLNLPVSILNMLIYATFLSQGVALSNYIIEYRRMSRELDTVNEGVALDNAEGMEKSLEFGDKIRKEENLVEQLKKEKDFYVGFSEPDKVTSNIRSRNIVDEKKNDSF